MGVLQMRTWCANRHAWSPIFRSLLGLTLLAVAAATSRVDCRAANGALCSFAECKCGCAAKPNECAAASQNFVVRSFVGGPAASAVAEHCEHVRSQLGSEVFDLAVKGNWRPRCTVVLHASRQTYGKAVGAAGQSTAGSTNVTFRAGTIAGRRIDLLVSTADNPLAALPHELAHVLFADAFPTTAPPKWAEEGLALLLDSPDKQARHRRDLAAAIRGRSLLPLRQIVADTQYPGAAHRATFYAQSLSLVAFLTDSQSPQDFMRFVKLSLAHGNESALQSVYGIGLAELETNWRKQLDDAS
jgi:hypothetical protein